MFKKILSFSIIICFFLTTIGPYPQAHADSILGLPTPGIMINLSPAYNPVIIKGLTIHKDNPFLFDFIVDVGQDKMSGEPLKKEGEKLIKYFLASLAIPDKDLWVNLSPYEKDRMIPEALGQTDMGRDLLEQDYILKQITASLYISGKTIRKDLLGSSLYQSPRDVWHNPSGVEMNVNPAMIAQIEREGVNWIEPVVLKMTSITSVWSLVGLRAP